MIYSVRRRSIQPHGLHRDSVYQHALEGDQTIASGCLSAAPLALAVVLTVARSSAFAFSLEARQYPPTAPSAVLILFPCQPMP